MSFTAEQLEQIATTFRATLHAEGLGSAPLAADLRDTRAELRQARVELEGAAVRVAELERMVGVREHELAEQRQLADDRGEEVRGRGEDLRAYEAGVERLVRVMWPHDRASSILNTEMEVAPLVAMMLERLDIFMRSALGEIGVDHATETLAQLECVLLLPVGTGGPESLAYGERWGRVAGRVAGLVERAGARDRHVRDEKGCEIEMTDDELAAALGCACEGKNPLCTLIHRAGDRLRELSRAHERRVSVELAEALRGIPVASLEAFLKRHEAKASTEEEPLRSVRLGFVQDLAALMVRHCAPPAAGLLGGTALVEPAFNGEVPACAAPCLRGPDGPSTREGACMLPVGHDGDHLDRSLRNKTPQHAHEVIVDATFGCLAPSATDDFILALRPKVAAWLQRIDEELLVRCRRAEPVAGCSCGAQFATTDDALDHECPLHQPLNPGETPECGAALPHDGSRRFRCARPAGHKGHHLSNQGDTWGADR